MTGSKRRGFEIPPEMEEVRVELENWRSTKRPRSRIPDVIWTKAVKLALRYGLHRTARALRLDYARLKEQSGIGTEKKAELGFVEWMRPAASGPECVIEFESGRGKKMRIELRGADAPDLAALGRTFWSRRG